MFTIDPKIEIFSPFVKPFSETNENYTRNHIVSDRVIEYMQSDNTKIVAKCTPCQCCACR